MALALLAALACGCGKKKEQAGQGESAPPEPPAGEPPAGPGGTGLAGAGGQVAASGTSKQQALESALVLIEQEQLQQQGRNQAALPRNAMRLMSSTPAEDAGDLVLQVQGSAGTPVQQAVAERLGAVIADINKRVKLPRDVPVVLKSCGEPNAFYNPDAHQIIFCDEMATMAQQWFAQYKKDPAARDQTTANAVVGTFLHELGHALVGEWKIPALGRQEDVADQLAAFVLIGGGDESAAAVLDWAEYYLALQAFLRGSVHDNFTDEHGLDEQRFTNLLCLVYGSNPDRFGHLVEDLDLPVSRSVRCKREFMEIKVAWTELLDRYLIK